MTHSDHIFDEWMWQQQLEEDREAKERLKALGYDDPEGTLFALKLLEMADEKGQS